ncbi:MAG: hypothetical protein C4541_12680 [Candidatus Auribacter fodinae]|jgi:uncharacterized protein YccT (UPF0319 family)|uniref:Uncharacterized protein n=1 Tax=Candidatus Auribacter fodinae TaxID=2093366 RepID=A0A3A4R0G3_9BACT|nr:MAG: hypothetical protein C4541_12680 [Candidatus Auribacter fodinae]
MGDIFFQPFNASNTPAAQPVQNMKTVVPPGTFQQTFQDINISEEGDVQKDNITIEDITPSSETKGNVQKYNAPSYRARSLQEFQAMQQRLNNQKSNEANDQSSQQVFRIPEKLTLPQQMELYKHEQLLSNPGGDNFLVKDGVPVYQPNIDHKDFFARIGKDIQDAGANFINALKDIGGGSKFSYIDKGGKISHAQKTGLFGTIKNFVGKVIDAFDFGQNEEHPPQGLLQTAGYMGKKIFVDGFVGDIVLGIPSSVINVGEDLLFGVLNAIEVIPDATIGNFEAGQKAVTTIFDNGQVAIDYITDVLPGGSAWMRAHSAGSQDHGWSIPFLYNIKTPVSGLEDPRWAYVQNTPFRKTLETAGSIIADISLGILPFIVHANKE